MKSVYRKAFNLNNVETSLKQPKLDIIEQLRSDFNVPGIVVAGAQSAGKSSLLESISGIRLPSGQTITTRVPLILRLQTDDTLDQPVALISTNSDLDKTGTKIDDISKIPKRIIEFTDGLCENGKVIDKPIHLKIVGKLLPTLTLIDLPGITHMSKNNIQEDIHKQTTDLVRSYISQENMIILCVIPAVDDFANAEALKLAREYDPNGLRTIGVVTKVDACNEHTGIKSKLHGDSISLELGFIAVRNKLPNEKTISINKLRWLEKDFFDSSPLFKNVNENYFGTNTLIQKITKLQISAVDAFMPKLKDEIETKIQNINNKLQDAKIQFFSEGEKMQYILRMIIMISSNFKDLATGQYPSNCEHKLLSRLGDFYTAFADSLYKQTPNFSSDDWEDKIQTAAKETQEILLDNFMSHHAFRILFVENHIERFHSQALSLVEKVSTYILSVFKTIIDSIVLNQFPGLKEKLLSVISDHFHQNKESLIHDIKTLINSEEFMFTRSNSYKQSISESGEVSHNLSVYSKIATTRVIDHSCMLTHKYLIKDMYEQIQTNIDIVNITSSIVEDPEAIKERNYLEDEIAKYNLQYELIKQY